MKKTIQFIAMATLCLFLGVVVHAQTAALKIGDKVPDVTINNIINYETTSAELSDFKGKLLILDFWATWCSPCIAMIPKMDSLEKTFDGKVQFLSVTYQEDKIVKPFMAKFEKQKGREFKLAAVNGDKVLHSMFPHSTLPHYVWIDRNGIVKAITGFEAVNAGNISKALLGEKAVLAEKRDLSIPYDIRKPMFVDNNGGNGSNTIFRTIFTKYTPGLAGRSGVMSTDSTFRIVGVNSTIRKLFDLAHRDKNIPLGDKILSRLQDPSKVFSSNKPGADYINWLKVNGYCYDLIVPISMADQAFEIMREDLKRFFPQYAGKLEKQSTKYLALVRTTETDKLKSSGGKSLSEFSPFGFTLTNFPLQRLVDQLNTVYFQNSPLHVYNETGYTPWVDLTVKANLTSTTELNEALTPYGLQLIEKIKEIEVLVIEDQPVTSTNPKPSK